MVTIVPSVTNWSVTPQNGQVGYFTLMNTWLFESTTVIDSLNTAINKINEAGQDINEIGTNAINAIMLDTIEDLSTYTGTGLVMIKDIKRGGLFVSKTAIEINPYTEQLYSVNGGTVFSKLGGGFWARIHGQTISSVWFSSPTNYNNYLALTKLNGINSVNTLYSTRFVGTATDDTGTPDAIYKVVRTHAMPNSAHSFRDETIFNPTAPASLASYDSQIQVNGVQNIDHSIGFQSRPEVNGTGVITDTRGFGFYPRVNSPVVNTKGLHVITAAGSGSIQNEYGIFIENLTRGINKYPIYIANNLGTSYLACRTQIDHALEVGSGKKMTFGGSTVNAFPQINFNYDPRTNAKTSADYSLGWNFTSTTMDLRHAPAGAIGDIPTWTNLLTVRTTTVVGTIRAGVDNTQLLGDSAVRWKEFYCANNVINTSDDRLKTYIDITDDEIKVAKELKLNMRKFKWNDSVKEKGESSARIHFGASAQTVKAIFEKHGLDASKYGLLCYDEWDNEYEDVVIESAVLDDDGSIIKEEVVERKLTIKAGSRYGIRYDQLLSFIISAL